MAKNTMTKVVAARIAGGKDSGFATRAAKAVKK